MSNETAVFSLRMKSWKWLLPVVLVLVACSSTVYPKEMPVEFDFSVEYGVEGRQKVDTFTDTVVKDLVTDGIVTSVLIGASRVSQIEENVKALQNIEFSKEELATIDEILAK